MSPVVPASVAQLLQPREYEAPLRLGSHQRERAPVLNGGGLAVPTPAQQVSARGGQQVIAGQPRVCLERSQLLQAGVDVPRHRRRDRAVQPHHRAVEDDEQQCVEGGDLRPVGVLRCRGLAVKPGDRGLQQVRPGRTAAQAVIEQYGRLVDLRAVPGSAVLGLQRDQLPPGPIRAARRASLDSISANSPVASGSSGISVTSSRVSRIASAERSVRVSWFPALAR